MSIYKQFLGEYFYNLHPMLQKRYEMKKKTPFRASGVMKEIKGGPKWLYPLFWLGVKCKLLFPEHGKDIPFTIVNLSCMGANGEEQVHWERIFHFGQKRRYFNARMSFDHQKKIIKDYLGEPSLFYSDLSLFVTDDGCLSIKSKKQRLVLGKIEIPLPRILQGLANVTEKYIEEKQVFHIKVEVRNPIIGTVFSYEGEFTSDDIS
ncbi:DUF4166 domain-containing protein [Risungbinella massiliensis]|uniref:DUF4166 domain-containing protein n=1 Tax=Risungbinella massiliensis TaxID=1329796 RepID=UPI0005CBE679|nr:DUF4166 domain-containing protein [Risungbinella massiliensis]